jgi:type IV pilus assembly protein PilA
MSLKNIKSKTQAQSGFTIVELLIVVVVIAILAAITIVSYNGITNRANASGAQAASSSLQKKAELYVADGPTAKYPVAISNLTTGVPSDKTYLTPVSLFPTAANGPLTADNGKSSARYYACAAGVTSPSSSNVTTSTITGARVEYWNYTTPGTTFVDLGNVGTATANCYAPAS